MSPVTNTALLGSEESYLQGKGTGRKEVQVGSDKEEGGQSKGGMEG